VKKNRLKPVFLCLQFGQAGDIGTIKHNFSSIHCHKNRLSSAATFVRKAFPASQKESWAWGGINLKTIHNKDAIVCS
jgi:hypothetical protein